MAETFRIRTAGDLEAVVVAGSYDLLGSIVGPYTYRVSGAPRDQQAIFANQEVNALFYIRVNELLAPAGPALSVDDAPQNLSLFSAGEWLAKKYPTDEGAFALGEAYSRAADWFNNEHRVVFWAPSVWRHLRLVLPMQQIIAMRANLEKHQLLRLDREIRRFRNKCAESGCELTWAEACAAREEFEDHIQGMLEYHATEVAEHVSRYFLAFYRFLRGRYNRNPGNNLDAHLPDAPVSDDVYRYMYASAVVGLSGWTEARIEASVPHTTRNLKGSYPQHADWSIVEAEGGDT
jgi:hypothetical protein